MVRTASSYDGFYDDEETMEVMKVLNLGKYFCSFCNSYKKHFFSGDNMIVIDDQNQGHTDNEQRNTQSLAIVPYVENNSLVLLPAPQSVNICMDPIYPDFYKRYIINTEAFSNTELERRFLEADWLTEQHMDELIDNVSTKDEMEADNVHRSTTKCKYSFK